MTQTITEHTRVCERKARIVCIENFIWLNRLMNRVVKMLLKCVNGFSISFRWYAFSNFWTQVSRPLADGVPISSKASATAAKRLGKLVCRPSASPSVRLFGEAVFRVCFGSALSDATLSQAKFALVMARATPGLEGLAVKCSISSMSRRLWKVRTAPT